MELSQAAHYWSVHGAVLKTLNTTPGLLVYPNQPRRSNLIVSELVQLARVDKTTVFLEGAITRFLELNSSYWQGNRLLASRIQAKSKINENIISHRDPPGGHKNGTAGSGACSR